MHAQLHTRYSALRSVKTRCSVQNHKVIKHYKQKCGNTNFTTAPTGSNISSNLESILQKLGFKLTDEIESSASDSIKIYHAKTLKIAFINTPNHDISRDTSKQIQKKGKSNKYRKPIPAILKCIASKESGSTIIISFTNYISMRILNEINANNSSYGNLTCLLFVESEALNEQIKYHLNLVISGLNEQAKDSFGNISPRTLYRHIVENMMPSECRPAYITTENNLSNSSDDSHLRDYFSEVY